MVETSLASHDGRNGAMAVCWRFGRFQLDTRERRLTRDGVELPLTPKAFDLLVYLVERNGHLVRKSELMDALWPDTVVGDVSLARQVSSLRKVLGDSQREQRLIRTVSKSGYRFVEAAQRLDRGATEAAPKRALAVLPFKPLGGEAEPHLALGLADTLITRLALMLDVDIRPINAVRRYTDPDLDPVAAGRALRVDSVLDGTLQRHGDRLRLGARLVAVPEGRTFWSQTFEQPFADVFAVQDAVAGQVADALVPALSLERRAAAMPCETRNAAAYELYLRGRYAWSRRAPQALESAVRYFEEALTLDQGFAAAHAARADALALLAGYTLPLEAFSEARGSAQRALELDAASADARAAWGLIAQKSELDWERAEAEYRAALQLQPRHLTALQRSGELLALRGRFDEGLQRLQDARRLDPVSASVGSDLAKAYFYARRYADGARECRTVLAIEPSFARARLYLGLSLMFSGDRLAGLAEVQAFAVEEDSPYGLGVLAWSEGQAGRPEQARRLYRMLVTRGGFVPPYALLLAQLAVGEHEAALDLLERMFAEGHNVLGLGVSPLLDALRGTPRYERFVARARLRANPGL
jgi:DNA-binding winged helix-turn-helix (wHTH) protein